MPVRKITRARLATPAAYRLQVNVDKRIVALLYGPMVEYYGSQRIAAVRNRLATAAGKAIAGDFAQAVAKDPQFAAYLEAVFLKNVEAELVHEAWEFWQANGLT